MSDFLTACWPFSDLIICDDNDERKSRFARSLKSFEGRVHEGQETASPCPFLGVRRNARPSRRLSDTPRRRTRVLHRPAKKGCMIFFKMAESESRETSDTKNAIIYPWTSITPLAIGLFAPVTFVLMGGYSRASRAREFTAARYVPRGPREARTSRSIVPRRQPRKPVSGHA
jgi:hypothetical protein